MHLLGIYSNHDRRGSLSHLAKKLAAVRANGGPRRRPVSCRQRSRRPGWVLEAIIQVLADRGEPMHVNDIHAAVEALVGEPVPSPSLKGALAKNAASSSVRFVRVARGRHTLARPRHTVDLRAATGATLHGTVPRRVHSMMHPCSMDAVAPTVVEQMTSRSQSERVTP